MPDSLSNRRRKVMASLTRRKGRRTHEQTLVEGPRAVASALDAGAPLVDAVVAQVALRDSAIQRLVERLDVPVYRVDADTMAHLADVETPQGIVAVAERRLAAVDALVDGLGDAGTALVLDGVQDPGNVGTILRTAAWFGADALVAGSGTAGLYGPKVMRAGAGGHWDLTLARTDTLGPLLDALRRAGCTLYGADLYGTDARSWAPRRPSALVLGSEAHGLSAAVTDRLDEPVALPGAPHRAGAESLNVAVAGGILVYEWMDTAHS